MTTRIATVHLCRADQQDCRAVPFVEILQVGKIPGRVQPHVGLEQAIILAATNANANANTAATTAEAP